MLSINIKRSVGALAVTAGLLAAGAPASHADSSDVSNTGSAGVMAPVSPHGSGAEPRSYLVIELNDLMISGVKAKTAQGSGAKVQVQDVHFSTKTKGAKGKRGKGKPTHTYDVQSSNHA